MTKFQLILTGIFGVFIIGGVIVFSAYRGSSEQKVTVEVWGTLPANIFNRIIETTRFYNSEDIGVVYTEKSEEEFDQSFIEALASGIGPDLFLLSSDKIIKHLNKILLIPNQVFTERQFKDTFIEGAETFRSPEGTIAMPVSVDPLVMYWNRSIFNEARVTQPPKYWDEFYSLAKTITQKDGALNIQRSAVAMGEYANISHAKEIISTLAMQAGTSITDKWQNGRIQSVFNFNTENKPVMPAFAAVSFYTEFSNPAKSSYSWNRSLPLSNNYFLSGDLALYFGYASELSLLQYKNPNLNFDVAKVPSSRDQSDFDVFGKFWGLAITKSSKVQNAAYTVASTLSLETAEDWSEATSLPPVRRNLLSRKQTDSYKSVFYDGAIRARGWLDPEPKSSDSAFRNMIESITSGRSSISDAITGASTELNALLAK
ncbi:MAG: extracellular solute-binding protein [Patescibacteria group bacterium]